MHLVGWMKEDEEGWDRDIPLKMVFVLASSTWDKEYSRQMLDHLLSGVTALTVLLTLIPKSHRSPAYLSFLPPQH
jgi:hypothetical protein